jgi:hypothetical protein
VFDGRGPFRLAPPAAKNARGRGALARAEVVGRLWTLGPNRDALQFLRASATRLVAAPAFHCTESQRRETPLSRPPPPGARTPGRRALGSGVLLSSAVAVGPRTKSRPGGAGDRENAPAAARCQQVQEGHGLSAPKSLYRTAPVVRQLHAVENDFQLIATTR